MGTALLLAALASQARAREAEVQRWELEPGTEVVLVEDHRAPLVQVVVEFPVGRWSPWAIENHAAEAFDIQFHDPEGRLRAGADRLAADVLVEMSDHAASIGAACLADDLAEVLALIRDVIDNREFDRNELRRWKKQDRLDWTSALKDPEFRLDQAGARLFYARDDPRRMDYEPPRPLLADPGRLVAVRDEVVRLPGRVIGFAGDLTREEAGRLAAGLLPRASDAAPAGLQPVFGPLTPPERRPATLRVGLPRIAQAFLAYGRDSPTYDDPRYPAFLVADHVLGGHFFSRLYRALRHEGGETYGASTVGVGGVYAELYALTTFTRGGNAEVAAGKLRDVLDRFQTGGITEEERQAAVGYLLGRRPFSRQSPAEILDRALWERRNGLPPGFLDALIDRAAATPLDEINEFVCEFYNPSRFTMVEVLPE